VQTTSAAERQEVLEAIDQALNIHGGELAPDRGGELLERAAFLQRAMGMDARKASEAASEAAEAEEDDEGNLSQAALEALLNLDAVTGRPRYPTLCGLESARCERLVQSVMDELYGGGGGDESESGGPSDPSGRGPNLLMQSRLTTAFRSLLLDSKRQVQMNTLNRFNSAPASLIPLESPRTPRPPSGQAPDAASKPSRVSKWAWAKPPSSALEDGFLLSDVMARLHEISRPDDLEREAAEDELRARLLKAERLAREEEDATDDADESMDAQKERRKQRKESEKQAMREEKERAIKATHRSFQAQQMSALRDAVAVFKVALLPQPPPTAPVK